MKKLFSSIGLLYLSVFILFAQKETAQLVIPNSSENVVINMQGRRQVRGKILEQIGDTVLVVNTEKGKYVNVSVKEIQSINPQSKLREADKIPPFIMLKFGAAITAAPSAILDGGIEFRVGSHFSIGVSHSISARSGEYSHYSKKVSSGQFRYYFTKYD